MPIQPQTPVDGQLDETLNKHIVANVNKVFTTLKITFPVWYEKYYGDEKSEQLAKRIWLMGIKKLTNEQVNKGLQRMVVESDFPPKLKDFIRLCLQLDLLPSLEVAWHEALTGNYSHKVVKVAAQLTGCFELRRATYDQFTKGELLDEAMVAIEQPDWLEKLEHQAEQRVIERIKKQGINAQNARDKCFLILGKRRSKH